MIDLVITKHAYKRYRQRVGKLRRRTLRERTLTAVMLGHYRQGEGLLQVHGIWWGCVERDGAYVLTTCYGRQDVDLIAERRRYSATTPT